MDHAVFDCVNSSDEVCCLARATPSNGGFGFIPRIAYMITIIVNNNKYGLDGEGYSGYRSALEGSIPYLLYM